MRLCCILTSANCLNKVRKPSWARVRFGDCASMDWMTVVGANRTSAPDGYCAGFHSKDRRASGQWYRAVSRDQLCRSGLGRVVGRDSKFGAALTVGGV